ncbi:MAG TPA: (d)CMP kinase [Burkholderiaceae bacterium]|jgi:cytidylate kinase|nr:(d)CMP kinase [Burkholderiaceae bacterium]
MSEPPVITIDGPTASGKGTIAQAVARALGFACLDSGALYRVVALLALRRAIDTGDAQRLAQLARGARLQFEGGRVQVDGEDLTDAIRTEQVGRAASRVSAHGAVRSELLQLQRSFRRWPGLVADGRDMGTIVFPDACVKVFLTASAEVRAQRRLKQLMEKGYSANLADLLLDLRERDERDRTRAVAPLIAADDAYELDTSNLGIDAVVEQVLNWYRSVSEH